MPVQGRAVARLENPNPETHDFQISTAHLAKPKPNIVLYLPKRYSLLTISYVITISLALKRSPFKIIIIMID
jgi:hypothetical protein